LGGVRIAAAGCSARWGACGVCGGWWRIRWGCFMWGLGSWGFSRVRGVGGWRRRLGRGGRGWEGRILW